MATATNPRDKVRRIAVTEAAWVEIKCTQNCIGVSIRQLPGETAADFLVKHRSDDGGEDAELIENPEIWEKGVLSASAHPGRKTFQIGDTFGFFQRSDAGTITLVVREHEV